MFYNKIVGYDRGGDKLSLLLTHRYYRNNFFA